MAQACSKSVEGKRCQFAPPPLTERELKVIRALAQGMSDRQIAHAVGISVAVRNQTSNFYGKLHIFHRTQGVVTR